MRKMNNVSKTTHYRKIREARDRKFQEFPEGLNDAIYGRFYLSVLQSETDGKGLRGASGVRPPCIFYRVCGMQGASGLDAR